MHSGPGCHGPGVAVLSVTPHTPGIDVSMWQGNIDWSRVAATGLHFAVIKATEGLSALDPDFPANWARSKENGLFRAAYHYLRPGLSGRAQADYLHGYVHDHGKFIRGDAVALDLETTDGNTPSTVIRAAAEFIDRAREQIAKPIILYTSPAFWLLLGSPSVPELRACPLWVADWGVLSPPALPNLAAPAFWQYSSTGLVDGVPGHVDLDLFYGSVQQLRKLFYG